METTIQIPTIDLNKSLLYYKKLNFKKVTVNILSDGKVFIEITQNKFARLGVKFYNEDWSYILKNLKKVVNITETNNFYLFSMPSGTWVYLMKTKLNINLKKEKKPFSILGNFAGVSLESTFMKKSIKILNILGFQKTMGDIKQGWVALTNNNGFTISIMTTMVCPHLFYNPSLTYFNGKDNIAIIKKINELKIPVAQEITHFNKENIVDNIILKDQSGLGFFIFSD